MNYRDCPCCGSKLEKEARDEQFVCMHCGWEEKDTREHHRGKRRLNHQKGRV